MHVRILGASAGGGLPQWNCGCENCRAARDGRDGIVPRTQSSLAVSADGTRWALFNASPDVRAQLAAGTAFAPPVGVVRAPAVACTVVTNADLDHTTGLLVLREGGAPPIYGSERVRVALTEHFPVLRVLSAFGPVQFRRLEDGIPTALQDRDGSPIGLTVEPFFVASKSPPYVPPDPVGGDLSGDTLGLLIRAAGTRRTLAYVPGVRDLDAALRSRLLKADTILIDGTCATDDELVARGLSSRTSRTMGHSPLSGPDGTLAFLAGLAPRRRVLVHVNNTNPVLDPRSAVHAAMRDAGVELGEDGMQWREDGPPVTASHG